MHIQGSINVPRSILESAFDYNYYETMPELITTRDQVIIVICRSGNRSALAAFTLQLMGYTKTSSLKTGLRGWNDYELPLVDGANQPVPIEWADEYFTVRLRPNQEKPED